MADERILILEVDPDGVKAVGSVFTWDTNDVVGDKVLEKGRLHKVVQENAHLYQQTTQLIGGAVGPNSKPIPVGSVVLYLGVDGWGHRISFQGEIGNLARQETKAGYRTADTSFLAA